MEEPLPDSPEALTAKQEAAIREQILLDMAPIHEKILSEIEEVSTFEDGIKRPYFHVKELERWAAYVLFSAEQCSLMRYLAAISCILFVRESQLNESNMKLMK